MGYMASAQIESNLGSGFASKSKRIHCKMVSEVFSSMINTLSQSLNCVDGEGFLWPADICV